MPGLIKIFRPVGSSFYKIQYFSFNYKLTLFLQKLKQPLENIQWFIDLTTVRTLSFEKCEDFGKRKFFLITCISRAVTPL